MYMNELGATGMQSETYVPSNLVRATIVVVAAGVAVPPPTHPVRSKTLEHNIVLVRFFNLY